jgi:Transposase DDE domain group 1
LLLLNLAGGDCMDDIRLLEADEGLSRMVQEAERYKLPRGERRAWARRFRKGRVRTFPSPSRICEWLERFHDADQERARVEGRAFVPTPNAHLEGLGKVNETLVASVQRHAPCTKATLDIDASLQETHKREALVCYQGYRAYQPLNVYWAETALLVYSQFRDGNVPAHSGILEALKASLEALPAGVETVRVRMDSAGYQHAVMKYCATGDGGRRDPIEFSIGTDLTPEFRAAVREVPEEEWHALPRADGIVQEWAEVVYVADALTRSRQAPAYRYLAIREKVEQGVLPGMSEGPQPKLPFATEVLAGVTYRLSGIVTNRAEEGAELIHWHHQRCGKSEEAHAILKTDLAGGRFPSGKFGANAAWWAIVVLAANLHAALRRLVLPGSLTPKRMKALRFALIAVPGRIVARGRQLFVHLARGHPALGWLTEMRRKLRALAPAPA